MVVASEFLGKDGIFAKKLKELMNERGVSQQKLASAVGTTRQAVGNYVDGAALPTIEKLYKIAKYFDVSADYFLGLSDSASSDIDERKIHEMLGLSENTIKLLSEQMTYLREITMEKQSVKAIDKYNSVRIEAENSPYLHFSDYIDHIKPFCIDYSDRDACIDARLFVPYSHILSLLATDEFKCDVLGELYDLIIFIEADSVFIPIEYDYDDLLAIRLVRLQQAFMKWVNRKLGRNK